MVRFDIKLVLAFRVEHGWFARTSDPLVEIFSGVQSDLTIVLVVWQLCLVSGAYQLYHVISSFWHANMWGQFDHFE